MNWGILINWGNQNLIQKYDYKSFMYYGSQLWWFTTSPIDFDIFQTHYFKLLMKYFRFLIKYGINCLWCFTANLISKVFTQSSLIEYLIYFSVYICIYIYTCCQFHVVFLRLISTRTFVWYWCLWKSDFLSQNLILHILCIYCMPCIFLIFYCMSFVLL